MSDTALKVTVVLDTFFYYISSSLSWLYDFLSVFYIATSCSDDVVGQYLRIYQLRWFSPIQFPREGEKVISICKERTGKSSLGFPRFTQGQTSHWNCFYWGPGSTCWVTQKNGDVQYHEGIWCWESTVSNSMYIYVCVWPCKAC